MSTLALNETPHAVAVSFSERCLVVGLDDGRSMSVPLSWFPRLDNAKDSQLEDWQLLGVGEGIHWPQLDEDISVAGLLAGNRARS
jgi:hypothetical protein